MNTEERKNRLLPDGKPRWVRCYDNGGETFDRYTVVFTGHFQKNFPGECYYVGMSEHPSHPQGFGQHGEAKIMIDRPAYSHIGKRITFDDLPEDCRKLVLSDYLEIWRLS